MGVVVPHQRKRASLGRHKRPAGTPTVLHICPTCGVQHRTEKRGSGLAALDERALRILRASALDELASAVRAGADTEHVADVLAVLDRCDERLTDE